MQRRTFVKSSLIVGATAVGAGLYTWQVEPFWLEFVNKALPIKNLPKAIHNRTLMQISDVHVGDRFSIDYLIDSFKKAKSFEPDFLAYTGDYVNYESPKQLDQLNRVLEDAPKGKLATVSILGNHDYGHGWRKGKLADKIARILNNHGLHVLRNEQKEFHGLNFIGLDDYWAINFDPIPVMQKVNPSDANIVLCHNPDVADLDVWSNYQGWILSGHTHGGQCKPPFLKPPMLPVKNKKYTSGQFDLADGRQLYINRALGHLWQVRFNVRPEITIFNLQQA